MPISAVNKLALLTGSRAVVGVTAATWCRERVTVSLASYRSRNPAGIDTRLGLIGGERVATD